MQSEQDVLTEIKCFHCGEKCEETHTIDDKVFCCYGCKTVYEILTSNDLCNYYALDDKAGVSLRNTNGTSFEYIDEPQIKQKLLSFDSVEFSRVQFYVPAVHCISCIWLLENLHKLKQGVLKSEVNFAKKFITVDFNPQQVKLSEIAQTMASVGYAPVINLEPAVSIQSKTDKSLVLKLAIAGFCFGNVMLFSFPEYLGLDHQDHQLQSVFSWLNILLSLPVFLYSDRDYLVSAWKSFQQRQINIDVPIAVGLVALFIRSVWDIATGFGPGYLDSFTGLVFFLLIGRWFQSKTYESLSFDRDFKSYFPLAVQKQTDQTWTPVLIYEIKKGDIIRIRNMEIVPADSILGSNQAYVDYSFVTGEAKPVKVTHGELIYAGGRLLGEPVTLQVEKNTAQSHLTSLWNSDTFKKPAESAYRKLIDRAAHRFTWIVLALAILTGLYWYSHDPEQVWLIITSVLMVACPCALALASPFTYGSVLREFGKAGLYLKNADVVERMAEIDTIVFDKTGTVTSGAKPEIAFFGELSDREMGYIKQLTGYSTHPLSSLLHKHIQFFGAFTVKEFKELPGKGIEATIDGKQVRIGSATFTGYYLLPADASSKVFISIDNQTCGFFRIKTSIRKNIKDMLGRLGDRSIALLSGDNEADRQRMQSLFSSSAQLLFNQSPHDKLEFVKQQQECGKHVMMLGDGLNDAGALKQSDVGIAVTDDTGYFTPASDGIVYGAQIKSLDRFIALAKRADKIVKIGFTISFFYNIIALSFAVSGHLTPLVAAILMPISSISVVTFTSMAVRISAWQKQLHV